MVEQPVGEGQPGRRVVQLDVPRERRATREEHGGAERGVHGRRASGRPSILPVRPPRQRETEARHRQRDDERRRQVCRPRARRGEERGDHDRREAEWEHELALHAAAGRSLDEQAATEREHAENERETPARRRRGSSSQCALPAGTQATCTNRWTLSARANAAHASAIRAPAAIEPLSRSRPATLAVEPAFPVAGRRISPTSSAIVSDLFDPAPIAQRKSDIQQLTVFRRTRRPQHSRDNGANPMAGQMLDGRAKAVEQPCDAPDVNVLTRTIDKFLTAQLGCALGR